MADRLIRLYFEAVNPSWPVIEESIFVARYRAFKSDRALGAEGWEVLLCVVMALAARHTQLAQDLGAIDPGIFFSRSEALRRTMRYYSDAPGIVVQTQILLLSSLYLALDNSLAWFVPFQAIVIRRFTYMYVVL